MGTRRDRERGSVLLALIVFGTLAVLAALTVLSVQGGMKQVTADRFDRVSVYAAESGVSVAMNYLRNNCDALAGWSAFVTPSNAAPQSPAAIPGNGILPGGVGNLMSADMQAWYRVEIFNNHDDPGFLAGLDQDRIVILRVEGHGPDGSVAWVEVGIHSEKPAPAPLVLFDWRQIL